MGILITSLVIIALINMCFILWCFRKLFLAYVNLTKQKIEKLREILLDIKFIRKRIFNKKEID